MSQEKCRNKIESLLLLAGVSINGDRPSDISVCNDRFFQRLLRDGSLALGESYMDGWWDSRQLDECMCNILRTNLDHTVTPRFYLFDQIKAMLLNLQNHFRAYHIGKHHYDIGNDLYRCMLDKYMIYSCGYWKCAETLDEAQQAKLDLVCRKLLLKPGMKVLDIGCGWGGMAKFAAEKYGVKVTGITVSREQARFAKDFCKGLPVTIQLDDYRNLHGSYDRILSLGMFEHVGYKNYRKFMKIVRRLLKNDGLFLLHTIGNNRSARIAEKWIATYIFPNSMTPSAKQICQASEELFVLEDWHNFGPDYDKTLMHWFCNFDQHWHELQSKYSPRFYRMWKFYLLSCAASFRARRNQLWHIVFSPAGVKGGYVCPR